MPLYVAGLPIFSKAYYATRRSRNRRSRCRSARGRTRSASFEVSRYIEFDRVKDWWGADLPVKRGSYNFDTVRYEFYRDRDVAFEGFTGKNYLYPRGVHRAHLGDALRLSRDQGRPRSSARPCRMRVPSGAQGWFFNTRRDKFKDPKVREALINAFDFEWTNKTMMYGAYERTAFGVPEFRHDGERAAVAPEELTLLEPFRGQVPDEVFGEPFVPPVSDGSGQDRALLRKAQQLLHDAGYPDQGRQAASCRTARA